MAKVKHLSWLEKVRIRTKHSTIGDPQTRHLRICFDEIIASNSCKDLLKSTAEDHFYYVPPSLFDQYSSEELADHFEEEEFYE